MEHDPESAPVLKRLTVSIRPMRHSDLLLVIELDASVGGGKPRAAYFERRLAAIEHSDTGNQVIFLVASSGSEVVGFIMGTITSGEFGLSQVTAIVDSIAVHPQYRHQNIGRQLIESFLSQSALFGATAAYTLVQWENWELLKVFHALGFALPSTILLERQIG
ncbi:MAG: GNAT family N-acetyltransferase [Ktedonobacterales bacterium]